MVVAIALQKTDASPKLVANDLGNIDRNTIIQSDRISPESYLDLATPFITNKSSAFA